MIKMFSLVLFVVVQVYYLSIVIPRDIKHVQIKEGDQERPDPPPPTNKTIKIQICLNLHSKITKNVPQTPTPPLQKSYESMQVNMYMYHQK